MGKKYLIDSNVIIDYTANRLSKNSSDFVEGIFDTEFLISFIVKIEVLGFNEIPAKLAIMEEFMATAIVLLLDDVVTAQTIQLRRSYKRLRLGDAIIAATALVYSLIVVTHNSSDFKNIEFLQVLDPWDM